MISLGGLVNQKAFGKFEMGKVISNPFATAFVNEAEGEDHEVSMANNSLDTIIKMATELKGKLGETEKDIPAWIQDHITNAENFISQAASNYHEYEANESSIKEASPCWKGYKQVGMKDKNGRQVPNCVPTESIVKEGRSVGSIQKDLGKTVEAIANELKAYKEHKDTPQAKKHVENLKKLNAVKNKLEAELDNSVTSLYRDAELKAED
jgi:hypothetical protein